MTKTNELKPCPFCGGKAERRERFDGYDTFGYVMCGACLVQTDADGCKNPENDWNCRDVPQWTTEPPTEEGFYVVYFANKDTNKHAVVHATLDRGEFIITLVYENDKYAHWFLKDWSGADRPTHWLKITMPPLPTQEDVK